MNEYIEREKVIMNSREYNLGGSYDNIELAVPVDVINSIPAVDVRAVVRGEWKRVDDYRYPWGCTNCHNTFSGRYNYCPNCGAKMEG